MHGAGGEAGLGDTDTGGGGESSGVGWVGAVGLGVNPPQWGHPLAHWTMTTTAPGGKDINGLGGQLGVQPSA